MCLCLCLGLLGCSISSGDEDLDRCEAAARKIAEVFAGNDDELRAQRYLGAVEQCTLKPDETLTGFGSAYLDCVDEAPHGAAVLRCRYEMEAAAKADALAKLEAAALPLMKDVCAGKIEGELSDDPRTDQVSELETKARQRGAEDDEIDDLLDKVRREAGCPTDADSAS